jgi:hypothetical protein
MELWSAEMVASYERAIDELTALEALLQLHKISLPQNGHPSSDGESSSPL